MVTLSLTVASFQLMDYPSEEVFLFTSPQEALGFVRGFFGWFFCFVFFLLRICFLLEPVLTFGDDVVSVACPFRSPRSLNLFQSNSHFFNRLLAAW